MRYGDRDADRCGARREGATPADPLDSDWFSVIQRPSLSLDKLSYSEWKR